MTQGFISSTLTLPVPVTSGGTGLTSTTINQLLYSSAANTIAGLATANNGVLVTSAGGVPSISSTLPSGMAATNIVLTTPTLGAATATSITFSPTTGGIVGTTTNDNADAGKVGEFVSSSVTQASPLTFTTGVQTNITSISLTAGDWDVFGSLGVQGASVSVLSGGVSTTSATIPALEFLTYLPFFAASGIVIAPFPPQRMSLSGTTTVYLVTNSQATGTAQAFGNLYARRRR